jgi:gas vesicle protein
MLFWIIQQTIISVVLIISVHYIYIFFKNNLTIPKTKDLVNKPREQYKNIYNSLKKNKDDSKEMKTELKNYLKTLTSSKIKKTENKTEGIQTAEHIFSPGNFTNY